MSQCFRCGMKRDSRDLEDERDKLKREVRRLEASIEATRRAWREEQADL
jgi:hypothetical protein